jgi:hypothetical protein
LSTKEQVIAIDEKIKSHLEKVRYYNTLRLEQIKLIHGDDFNVVGDKLVFKDKVLNSVYLPYEKILGAVEEKPEGSERGNKKFGGRKYETRE